MNGIKLKKVYAITFSCEPNRGSEPGVGYHFAEALARLSLDKEYRIILFTRSHTAEAVRAELSRVVGPHFLEVEPVPIPIWLVAITKRVRVRVAYVFWQLRVVLRIRRLTARDTEPFVVHHITFATEAIPSFEKLCGSLARRVFGPAGSSQVTIESERMDVRRRLRRFLRRWFGKSNIRNVNLAIANNGAAAITYSSYGANRVIVEPNIVVNPEVVEHALDSGSMMPMSSWDLICVGGLVPGKRMHLAIEALALIEDSHVSLVIVGTGPLEPELRQRCTELELESRVTFAGQLPRVQTLSLIARSRVLVHPSVSEGSSWVVGESQAVGTIPVVCAGSGAESIVLLGGAGLVADSTPASIATRINEALGRRSKPTNRWDSNRLPILLRSWYREVLNCR